MAHKSSENSASSQFYFSLSEQPQFDQKSTVIGQTIQGLEAVHALRIGDRIYSIRILNASPFDTEAPEPEVKDGAEAGSGAEAGFGAKALES